MNRKWVGKIVFNNVIKHVERGKCILAQAKRSRNQTILLITQLNFFKDFGKINFFKKFENLIY